MENCYSIEVDPSTTKQSIDLTSFIGGKPLLPEKLQTPSCKLCGNQQTFFLQITFPKDHKWSGLSLAIFACTSCSDEDHLIPEMLKGQLKGINIPDGFLLKYQNNFKFLTFETKNMKLQLDYEEKIRFKNLILKPKSKSLGNRSKLGGMPSWLLEDESPSTYNSVTPMFFLMQFKENFQFEKLPKAPPNRT